MTFPNGWPGGSAAAFQQRYPTFSFAWRHPFIENGVLMNKGKKIPNNLSIHNFANKSPLLSKTFKDSSTKQRSGESKLDLGRNSQLNNFMSKRDQRRPHVEDLPSDISEDEWGEI